MSHDDRDTTDRDEFERDEFDRDDALRALLRSADPAATLAAADRDAVAGLLDEITRDPARDSSSAGPDRRPRRGVGTWLVAVAAAAVVVTAGVGAVHEAMSNDTETVSRPASPVDTTTAAPQPLATTTGTAAPAPARTVLSVSPDSFQARCAVPNAASLQQTDTAFAGTVTAIAGKRVTLQRSDTFRGDVADTVVVRAPIKDISRLVQTVDFEVGKSYLVAATGGVVSLCGFTGPAQPQLQGVYSEAFPG